MQRNLSDINQIIIHSSGTRYGDAAMMDRFAREIGARKNMFHHVILNGCHDEGVYEAGEDGKIQDGRPLAEVGAHCPGHNDRSIGICLIGNGTFTEAQMELQKKQQEIQGQAIENQRAAQGYGAGGPGFVA